MIPAPTIPSRALEAGRLCPSPVVRPALRARHRRGPRRARFHFGLFLLAILLGEGSVARAFAIDSSAWQLKPVVRAGGGGIFLEDILENPPAALPHLRLAGSPPAGQTATFTRAQIAALLRQLSPALAPTNWTGAAQIAVARRSRPLEETELKQFLTDTLQREQVKERGVLELRFPRPWASVLVPDEPLTLRVLDLPAAGVTANFIARFELRAGDELAGTFQWPVQARILREVWVAGSPLTRGQLLAHADLTRERRDLLALHESPATFDAEGENLQLAENVQAGAVLTARSVRVRPVVQRGKVVDAIVQDGSMVISVKAEVLEEGIPGQTVRVRNLKSKREFRGKVQNEETVLVAL